MPPPRVRLFFIPIYLHVALEADLNEDFIRSGLKIHVWIGRFRRIAIKRPYVDILSAIFAPGYCNRELLECRFRHNFPFQKRGGPDSGRLGALGDITLGRVSHTPPPRVRSN